MKFNWVETELTGKEFAIADITNNGNKEGQVIVIRSAKEDSIQVNVRHHVYSYNLEQCGMVNLCLKLCQNLQTWE